MQSSPFIFHPRTFDSAFAVPLISGDFFPPLPLISLRRSCERVLESRRRETSKFFLGPGCSTFADHGLSFNLQRGKKSFRGSFRDLSSGGLREEKKKENEDEKKGRNEKVQRRPRRVVFSSF